MNKEFASRPRAWIKEQPCKIPRESNPRSQEVSQRAASFLTQIDTDLVTHRDDNFLAEIEQLRQHGDRVGIQRPSSGNGEMQNYDIFLARWGAERAQTLEEKYQFRETELDNITTALKERKNTVDSTWTLKFTPEGKLYNPAFSKESWEAVLERGILYRKNEGSQDLDREQAEFDGFRHVQQALGASDALVGTKFVSISAPSSKENTPYVKNFVDVFELKEDAETKERSIYCTRFASSTDYDGYVAIVDELAPQFAREKGHRDDAWFLAHPIAIADADSYKDAYDVFNSHFAKDGEAMSSEAFEELYRLTLPLIHHYLRQVTSPEFDPIKIAESWNTVLHGMDNDELRRELNEQPLTKISGHSFMEEELNRRVGGLVNKFGRREVEEVRAGCGSSGGVSIQNKNDAMLGNSVSQFGQGGSGEYTGDNASHDPNLCRCAFGDGPHFHCPSEGCDHAIVVGKGISACPGCGAGKTC